MHTHDKDRMHQPISLKFSTYVFVRRSSKWKVIITQFKTARSSFGRKIVLRF